MEDQTDASNGGGLYKEELKAVTEALHVATEISRDVLRRFVNNDDGSLRSETDVQVLKDDSSPVTIADLAIQAVITSVLRKCFPEHGIIAEESAEQLRKDPDLLKAVHDLAKSHAQANAWVWAHGGDGLEDPAYLMKLLDAAAAAAAEGGGTPGQGTPNWVIDPIDGTAAFIRGEQYAINVALVDKNYQQVFSAVACPLLSVERALDPKLTLVDWDVDADAPGSLVYATRGRGAYIRCLSSSNPHAVFRLPDAAKQVNIKAPRLRECTSSNVSSGKLQLHIRVVGFLGAVHAYCDCTSWVLRWVGLALGKADFTVWVYDKPDRYAKIWDHAGAMLLFEETGGRITDQHGKLIDLSRGRMLNANSGFVAARRAYHGVILEALQNETEAYLLESERTV